MPVVPTVSVIVVPEVVRLVSVTVVPVVTGAVVRVLPLVSVADVITSVVSVVTSVVPRYRDIAHNTFRCKQKKG